MEDVARYKWDQAKYDSTVETSDFLKRLKVIAKQVFQDNVAKFIRTFLFEKLSINNQEDLMNNNKENASPERFNIGDNIITDLHKQQHNSRSTKHQ